MMSNEKPGGHGDRAFAAGAIDMAVWDATAKILGKPLWRVLSERYNGGTGSTQRVLVYSGGGYYYPGKEKQGLQDEMRQCRDLGYRLMKMKIGGAPLAEDIKRIEWALEIAGDGENLAVDANGRFDLDTALAYARAMSRATGSAGSRSRWSRSTTRPTPCCARRLQLPIATGENLFSVQDFRNLVRHGGMRPHKDWLQPDPSLCYGLTEALRILDMADRAGWSRRRCVPHGGHQLGLNMAAGLQLGGTESYPGVFQPYGGFADDIPVVDGYVRPAGGRPASAWSCGPPCSPTCASDWSSSDDRASGLPSPLGEKVPVEPSCRRRASGTMARHRRDGRMRGPSVAAHQFGRMTYDRTNDGHQVTRAWVRDRKSRPHASPHEGRGEDG